MTCPQCGEPCERDEVDVGVGMVPAGPWGCPACHWVEKSGGEMKTPYTVEVENQGCAHCAAGRTWTVVGPDDVAIGQSFDDREIVDEIADYMNMAYEAGAVAQSTKHAAAITSTER